ncbi:putative ankyrin repeat-containing protein [Exophiala viscosa]|uniref:putative ankyrin repeat-containing protein n=1 Tax=Exophiala viscosa TaxID=2486360 RepID=UPI002190F8D4|nr:putative ankyrin repeat-containing protein [Exophiala viscosa]
MSASPRSSPSHVAALSRDDYHIGLVFALPKELAAGKAMLDEEHRMIHGQDPQDGNSYSLGRVHEHNVVLACLPVSVDGTTAAAAVAVNMLRTFRALRFALMVGIGGGIPTTRHDIRLGDIVVSEPQGTGGGVVQYTKGKVRPGRFEVKGTLNVPPIALLTALASLKADHELQEGRVPGYLSGMIQRYPRMRRNGYSYPGTKEDSQPEIHYGIIASGDLVVKDAGFRESLSKEYDALCVEMEAAGLMNNFPCLVVRGICDYADSHKNDTWHKYAAATAAAFAQELLYYVSSELANNEMPVQQVMGALVDHLKTTKDHTELTRGILEETRQQNRANDVRYDEEKYRACHRSFKISSYEADKNRNPDRVRGTCLWALRHPTFQRWQQSTHDDLLWISADPGCGKSVLVKSLIDNEFKSTKSHTVCYFFFKNNDLQDKLRLALCAMLHQLFEAHPDLIRHAIPAWDKNHDKLQLESAQLWQILINAATDEAIGDITCIFDALDECCESDQAELIHGLCRFYQNAQEAVRPGSLRFLVTSRPYSSAARHFQPLPSGLPSMRLRGEEENDTLRQELDLVIRQQVAELAEDVDLDAQTREKMETKLLAMEHRTYLWLHLAFESIRHTFQHSPRPAQESIKTLPVSVEDAYEKILGRVGKDQQGTVKKISQIVVGARRALTVEEMSTALGVAIARQVVSWHDVHIDTVRLEKNIRDWCGLFVFISHSKIYLIHQTAKEFLMSDAEPVGTGIKWRGSFSVIGTEASMGCICVNFLPIQEVDWDTILHKKNGLSESGSAKDDLTKDVRIWAGWYGFLHYSAEYWPVHFANVHMPADPALINSKTRLYDTSSHVFRIWYDIFCHSLKPKLDREISQNPHPLELAALFGHNDVLKSLLLTHSDDANFGRMCSEEALGHACTYGHAEIVRTLLEHGVHANSNSLWGTALVAAAGRGQDVVLQMLLQYGADPNLQSVGQHGSPLIAAVSHRHGTAVEILLAAGASIDLSITLPNDGDPIAIMYGNALIAAAFNKQTPIVQLFLDEGADVDARPSSGTFGTALIAASWAEHSTIVQQLLDHGADPNLQAEAGEWGTALIAACYTADTAAVGFLLDRGADISAYAQSGAYGTALIAACARLPDNLTLNSEIVHFLLSRQADINAHARSGNYGTALMAACYWDNFEIVHLLLDWQADIHAQAHIGETGTALIAACCNGRMDTVQLLLDREADVNACARTGEYGTALIAASYRRRLLLVRTLIEHGADVNARGQVGDYVNALAAAVAAKPRWWASGPCARDFMKARKEVMKLLLGWGPGNDDRLDDRAQIELLPKRRRHSSEPLYAGRQLNGRFK